MELTRQNLGSYLALFLGGLVWDAIVALNLLFVADRIVAGVFISSFVLTYIVVLMYNHMLVSDGKKRLKLFVLAVASGLGASLTTCYFDVLRTWILALFGN